MRKLIIVAIACSTFGGVLGVLITAATQSQASPGAIAAAVQRVEDQSADRSLTSINTRLAKTNTALASLKTTITHDLSTDLGEVVNDLGSNGALAGAAHNLAEICAGVATSQFSCDPEVTPAPIP